MATQIDVNQMVDFLVQLLNIPSPTGDTDRAMAFVQEAFAPYVQLEMSPKGLLAGTIAGERSDAPRALTAHVDTLGAMVSSIKPNGRLAMTRLGGWVWNSVEGEGVRVFTSDGRTYRGSIVPTAASAHAHSADDLTAKRTDANMEIRLDERVPTSYSVLQLGIQVGDFVAMDPRVELSDSGFIRSRHLDDKAGVATMLGAIQALHAAGQRPLQDTTIHISNYEEVGHGAATGFPANLAELISIDMAVVAPSQQSDEFSVTICAKDSAGPYHAGLRRRLEKLARDGHIAHRTDIYPNYSSDGEAYWKAGGNVAMALVGPGVDASHHYERTHREALDNTARLLAAYLVSEK